MHCRFVDMWYSRSVRTSGKRMDSFKIEQGKGCIQIMVNLGVYPDLTREDKESYFSLSSLFIPRGSTSDRSDQ